jgi:hypothetical protein
MPIYCTYGCITVWCTRVISIERELRIAEFRPKLSAFSVLARLTLLSLIYLA